MVACIATATLTIPKTLALYLRELCSYIRVAKAAKQTVGALSFVQYLKRGPLDNEVTVIRSYL